MIAVAFTSALATPGFSEEKTTGTLLGIRLEVTQSNGMKERIDATEIKKIRLGEKIIITNGKAEENNKGDKLADIELFYDVLSKKVSTHVEKAKKIKIGDEITIKDGKAIKKGARGC